MEPKHRTTLFTLFLLYVISFFHVCAQQPDVKVTYFINLPTRLFFLDDTTTLFALDSVLGEVHISQDEGKTWEMAAGIPSGEAVMVVEHPFNNRYVFVLTGGLTHYRTDDRGKTWRSFNVPIPLAFVPSPLSFHSEDFEKILYQGTKCEKSGFGWNIICHDETYYTTDAFSSDPNLLLSETSSCVFAHSSKDFKHDSPTNLIFCVAFDTSSASNGGMHTLQSSRLFSSEDFFQSDPKLVDLGIGKNARGVIAFAVVSKFAVVALKDLSVHSNGEMLFYVTTDAKSWAKAEFPQSSSAKLMENAYTIVESTTHSLGVDVLLHPEATLGTLFMSNSNGTYFVESLKDTNRNELGFVDYETIYGIEGVGVANIVKNSQDVLGRRADKQLETRITFDDGSNWSRIKPPSTDADGNSVGCNPADATCSLHLHSVTNPHNFGRIFSSPAPGLVMGVGSIGDHLLPYEQCDTFLSIDGGITWNMIEKDAHLYEFGDQGSILVVVNDEDGVDNVRYSSDLGRSWNNLNLGVELRARALITVPDSTSQKFVLVGQLARKDQTGQGRFAIIFLDFAPMRGKKCTEDDFERWYARSKDHDECIMGHKQWYKRRKSSSDCYVGEKFNDPVGHEENCACIAMDYECDYGYIREGDQCVPSGPEPIPAGVCEGGTGTYTGSSGFRLIPGNTCEGGIRKDAKVEKDCSKAEVPEGAVVHQQFDFPSEIMTNSYFKDSTTILVRLRDNTVWQSSNEGYTWTQLLPDERFVAIYMHSYAGDRAYLITMSQKVFFTVNAGKNWQSFNAPSVPNTFGAQILHFHPYSDYLIWTGNVGCDGSAENCHAEAHYSTRNGDSWNLIDSYCRNCVWARDAQLRIDASEIICESYRDKTGNQRTFGDSNPMGLVGGTNFMKNKVKYFDRVVGFTKFSEFLIVAEYQPSVQSLDLQVSLDGKQFAAGVFPSSLRPQNHAYTILESSTKSVFMHVTTSEFPFPYWGTIIKSNSNGTYYSISLENVNRNDQGFVDFEKMINLDGIALVNVIADPQESMVTRQKSLQTRITHNDGGTWKPLTPPVVDSEGQPYSCATTKCNLHIHGYTERYDARATYSSPSVPGLLMAVGNVGEGLAPYGESDTYLSRDAGFTWEEVHKDAHLWEFGDSGSVLVIANDEEPTDHILFSTNEGLSWREYIFSQEKIRVRSIVTVPSDTSRKFILFGYRPQSAASSVAIHLDFSALTRRQCQINTEYFEDPDDDFELFSPSEEREELCLFGRQTLYHRRKRDRECVVGDQPKADEKVVKNCPCTKSDFECEYNHVRNENGECTLAPGQNPLPSDETCSYNDEYWYERTAYRKIAYSSCEDGFRLDRGSRHPCPGIKGHGALFWMTVIFVPTAIAGLIGYWIYRRSGLARGNIRLPGDYRPPESGVMETIASVPWFVIGLVGIAWERLRDVQIPLLSKYLNSRTDRGYRNVAVDEDAPVLRFEDEE